MKKIILFCLLTIGLLSKAYSQNVIYGEYFIDAEMGFGNANSFTITFPDSDITQSFNVPYSSFSSPGYHFIYYRTLDDNGNWSITKRKLVEVDENIGALYTIKVEYFFDTDNGVGLDSSLPLIASTDSTWNFNIPFNQIPLTWTPNDTLFLRVQDSVKGNWSITTMIDSLNFTWVGIDELAAVSGVTVFPNPFVNEISVTPNDYQSMRFVLYSESGQLIIDKIIKQPTKINTEQLSMGAYIIFVCRDKQPIYRSMVIKQ